MKIYTRHKIIAAVLTGTITLAGGLLVLTNLPTGEVQSPSEQTRNAPPQTTITYEGVDGKTILSQLESNKSVTTTQSSYGTLVESIEGLKNGTDGKYWLFYVNGQMADKGADSYLTKTGDVVTWKFEKS